MSEFFPQLALITDISNAQNAVVTFSEDHSFLIDEIISFRVSRSYGMVQINNQQAKILSVSDDTATVDIDSSNFTSFSVPGSLLRTTPPCAVPVGSGISSTAGLPRTILEDAFDNRP
jgi:hypothetical protein